MNLEDSSYNYSEEEEEMPEEWVECVVDSDYEICTKYPYNIRRKGTKRIIAKTLKKDGYLHCTLNRKHYCHHRIVALQFIPNDNPEKNQVDHINRIKTDNHISNLRWVDIFENNHNRGGIFTPYVYTDEIDDESIELKHYGNRELGNYYYDINLDQFYHKETDGKYRILHILHKNKGYDFVYMRDKNNARFEFNLNMFKKLYDLE